MCDSNMVSLFLDKVPIACSIACSVQLNAYQVRPGLPEGTQFVFDKEGDVGPKNKAGPVGYILKAQQHPRFTCKGSDLLYTAQIPLYQALCGTALPVETLDGRWAFMQLTPKPKP